METLKPQVITVRVGHRPERDKRITSHTALTSRAFGAIGFILATECDNNVSKTVLETEYFWGRGLSLSLCGINHVNVLNILKKHGFKIVHLTMYGINIDNVVDNLKNEKKLAVVIGAEKVPPELYDIADYNLAIGNQPHSEVAALAVFLDRLYNGKQLNKKYEYARLVIEPSSNKKKVVQVSTNK